MKTLLQSRRALLVGTLLLGCMLVLLSASPASAEKETRKRWILKADFGQLRTVQVRGAGGTSASYHYLTMKVTNGTKFARQWHPLVKAETDTNKTYLAGSHGTAVLNAIRKAERNKGLTPIGRTAGKLKPGASVNGVAIFGKLDPLYDRITVKVFGLVDPIATYKIEQYGAKSTAEKVVLGKDSVVVDSAYWDHNQVIMKRLKKAAKDAGGDVPRPAVEYQEVAEARYWSMNFERLGDEFHAEDDIIKAKGSGWKVAGKVGEKGGPKGLRVISTEG